MFVTFSYLLYPTYDIGAYVLGRFI